MALAETSDVAVELGMSDDTAMSNAQKTRAEALLDRVSHLFAIEAQRDFEPGTVTNRLRVQHDSNGAYVRLSENPDSIDSVVDDYGNDVAPQLYWLSGRQIRLRSAKYPYERFRYSGPSLDYVTVTYTHTDPIPAGVRQTVASIVARYMRLTDTVGPSAGAATELGAGAYRATFADWVTRSVHLTPEDCLTAYAYRHPGQAPIVIGT